MSKRGNPYQRPDHFTKKAKEQGFPARSVFKLEEIDRRVRILKPGQRVLDLGAAPGSWSMYVAQKIGERGQLLSVDLSPLSRALGPNARFVQGDALSLDNRDLGLFAPYDVVLSDMAPSTTGTKEADQAQSFRLFDGALDVAAKLLRPGGSFVGKIFMGGDFPVAKRRVKELFEEERTIRPEAIRGSSFELFLVGLRRKTKPELSPAAT